MCGGFGKHFNQTNKPLAWHMKKFAVKQGIPFNKIITENKSFNTIENISFSKSIIDQHKWKSIILVSSKYHIPRIKMIYKHIFSKNYKLKFVFINTPNDNKKEILDGEKRKFIRDEKTLKK